MSVRSEELLDLAETLLHQHGLERFGVNSLARAAGMKPPSLYKHFAGVEDIEHALMARWFRRLADRFSEIDIDAAPSARVSAFISAYREHANSAPQLYRLATERQLNRELLNDIDPGSELAAMQAVIRLFGESAADHDRSRQAWAMVHGMVSLEQAGRFPPGVDLTRTWELIAESLRSQVDSASPGATRTPREFHAARLQLRAADESPSGRHRARPGDPALNSQ